jgi:putative endonuclease
VHSRLGKGSRADEKDGTVSFDKFVFADGALMKNKNWFAYILECGDGSLYAGSTNDLKNRVETHSTGKGAKYTRSHLPVSLVYSEELADRSLAAKRESEIKKLSRKEKLALVRGFKKNEK